MMNEALRRIIAEGDTEALANLLRRGELMSLTEQERHDVPCQMASFGQTELLKLFCTRSHAIALAPDGQGWTVLHAACEAGFGETAAYAAEVLGMDPLLADARGSTPLELAQRAPRQDAYRYLTASLGFGTEDCYRNPVRRGFYPDPSVVRVGNDFYMINSTFTHVPCLPISHSVDLVHWETVGHAVTDAEASGVVGLPSGYGYWAPDLSYYKGRFWVVATLRRDTEPFRLQMICSAERPEGPYDAPRFLDIDGIDPSLFTDVDGRRYIVVNPGVQIAEIDAEGRLLEEPQLLYFGSSRVKSEGPHLLHRDGWYYLFQAEGGTGANHTVTVARSRTLRGRYAPCPFNPILGRRSAANPIGRSGHGKPFTTPDGAWYMVYLCGREAAGCTMLGRETALDPMTWTADGWPMVNELRGPSCLQRCPALPRTAFPPRPLDPADGASEWIAPRRSPAAFARKTGDALVLDAGGDPANLASSSVLLRRQSELYFVQQAEVHTAESGQGIFAGLIGYYDERSFFQFGLRDGRLLLHEQVGDEARETELIPWESSDVCLRVEAAGLMRRVLVRRGDVWQSLRVFRADYLSDEGVKGGKRFTGATLGLFAQGAGTASFRAWALHFAETADVLGIQGVWQEA